MQVNVTEDEFDAIYEVYDCWASMHEGSNVPQHEIDKVSCAVWSFIDKFRAARQKREERNLINRAVRIARKKYGNQ